MDPRALRARFDASNVSVDPTSMSLGQRFLVASLLGAALWNSIYMGPLIFLTFKRYWTLYFWTMVLSNLGVLICATEQVMSVGSPGLNPMITAVMACVGWSLMVTGQSLVLYSRLHMLFISKNTLRLVLSMIIFNAVVIHSAGTALTIGVHSHLTEEFLIPYRLE